MQWVLTVFILIQRSNTIKLNCCEALESRGRLQRFITRVHLQANPFAVQLFDQSTKYLFCTCVVRFLKVQFWASVGLVCALLCFYVEISKELHPEVKRSVED